MDLILEFEDPSPIYLIQNKLFPGKKIQDLEWFSENHQN